MTTFLSPRVGFIEINDTSGWDELDIQLIMFSRYLNRYRTCHSSKRGQKPSAPQWLYNWSSSVSVTLFTRGPTVVRRKSRILLRQRGNSDSAEFLPRHWLSNETLPHSWISWIVNRCHNDSSLHESPTTCTALKILRISDIFIEEWCTSLEFEVIKL